MPAPSEPSTAVVVLAAGGGSRFTGPGHKLLAPIGPAMVLQRAVSAAVAADVGEVVVVLGALAAADVGLPPTVAVVEHANWSDGQASSLRAACAWAAARGHGAVVVGLGDQPGLDPAAWRLVAAATATPISIATYAGHRGHPVRLAASTWADLPTTGDSGARALLAARPDLVSEVPCPGSPADVDTIDDLARWTAILSPPRPGSAADPR